MNTPLRRYVPQDDNATPAHTQRRSTGPVIALDAHPRAGKARHDERLHAGAATSNTKPRYEPWAHIGRDMRHGAPPVRVSQRHVVKQSHMGLFERLGHEVAIRIGVLGIVGVLVALWKGWI